MIIHIVMKGGVKISHEYVNDFFFKFGLFLDIHLNNGNHIFYNQNELLMFTVEK